MTRFMSDRLKRQQSAHKYAYRQRAAARVKSRWSESGEVCEGCGLPSSVVEVSHRFGKGGHLLRDLGDGIASSPLLSMALCCKRTPERDGIGCHELVDENRDIPLRDRLRWEALDRYCDGHRLARIDRMAFDPVGGARELERMVREAAA